VRRELCKALEVCQTLVAVLCGVFRVKYFHHSSRNVTMQHYPDIDSVVPCMYRRKGGNDDTGIGPQGSAVLTPSARNVISSYGSLKLNSAPPPRSYVIPKSNSYAQGSPTYSILTEVLLHVMDSGEVMLLNVLCIEQIPLAPFGSNTVLEPDCASSFI
jgi:hypothetical protein